MLACRPHSLVQDSLKQFTAQHADERVPRPLLRGLLEEALAPQGLAAGVNLQGSRLAAAWGLRGQLLVASPCGRASEDVSLSVLAAAAGAEQGFQVREISGPG